VLHLVVSTVVHSAHAARGNYQKHKTLLVADPDKSLLLNASYGS